MTGGKRIIPGLHFLRSRFQRVYVLPILLLTLLLASLAAAQSSPASQPQSGQPESGQSAEPGSSQSSSEQQLAETSRKAADAGDETAQFKESASVQWLAHRLGISLHAAYWLAYVLNFLIIAVLVAKFWRASVPQMFRSRTASIQKAIEDARAASAEAKSRLAAIEARLSRLDVEIASIRQEAEHAAAVEEQKIQAAAAEETRRIIEAAEQEIAAAVRLARRDLKAYAAGLAVSVAQKQIRVDDQTDQALVRSFADHLADGSSTTPNAHKDGHH